ncbi:MAG: hypothetical protein PHE87_09840, partial [Victivallaceae bacterium]|nr:hypothetical protein [Victivallaceae bacterium]
MNNNTVVTACNQAYAWGVWLLVVSMRQHGMDEPVLVGTYDWSKEWLEDIERLPGVSTAALSTEDKRNLNCSKPVIMMKAESEVITWVDCDGIFSGNCSDKIFAENNQIYIRSRGPTEMQGLYHLKRSPNDPPDTILPKILEVWQRDVGERKEPLRLRSCSTCLISVQSSQLGFIERWHQQMLKVLPDDLLDVVNKDSVAYLQTDESVLNSLLCFAEDAPLVTENYRADRLEEGCFMHFTYGPKPWQMWNPYAIRFYDDTLDAVEFGIKSGWLPRAKLPYTLKRRNKLICQLLAPLARNVVRFKK